MLIISDKISKSQKIGIRIDSTLNGDRVFWETEGEYSYKDNQHWIAYTDYSGNLITKNGLFVGRESMLIHRVGGITCDMFFDPLEDTIVQYNAFMVKTAFVLHTAKYHVDETNEGIKIHLEYSLDDGYGTEKINGQQDIEIS